MGVLTLGWSARNAGIPGVAVPPALPDLIYVDDVVLVADEPGGCCGFCSLSG